MKYADARLVSGATEHSLDPVSPLRLATAAGLLQPVPRSGFLTRQKVPALVGMCLLLVCGEDGVDIRLGQSN